MVNAVIFSDVNGVVGFGRYGGAYKVATELRRAGYSVQVVEFFADLTLDQIRQIAEKYIDYRTLFVGFATTLMIRKSASPAESRLERTKHNREAGHLPQDDEFVQEMFALFRRRNPNLKIVIGGGKAATTSLAGVDFWVWGAADRSVIALAHHLSRGAPLTSSDGRTGQVVANTDYPYHDYATSKIVWTDSDLVTMDEHLPIEIDRGCIFRCTFCANTLFKRRGEFAKDPETLREELLDNYDRFGTTGYMFCDDTFNDSQEKILSLHPVLTSLPFRLEWTGFGRVDVIYGHPEQRELLAESGIRAILFGIETFHQVAGRGIGKGLHPEKVKETLWYLNETWKGQVTMTGSFIVGLPGEPEDSVWETVEWLQRDDCPLTNAVFSPLNIRAAADDPNAPMSKIAKDPAKYGYHVTGPKPGRGISTDGPYWANEHMDKSRAQEIVAEIHRNRLREGPIGDWAVYSRLRSLGYSHEHLVSMRASNEQFVADAIARRERVKEHYISRLLSLG